MPLAGRLCSRRARRPLRALPLRGAPLSAQSAIAYTLDLPASAPRSLDRTAALVVADPAGNLEGARKEGAAVATSLAQLRGWSVASLDGSAATGARVRTALATSTFFHYAGHGQFAGADGWESALPLAEGSRLAAGDVLALVRPPERVVLSGCDGAGARDASLGMAQAFLVAGSDEVIAATRKVDDRVAEETMAALYRHLAAGAADAAVQGDLADALRRAELELAQQVPTADWAAFRVLRR